MQQEDEFEENNEHSNIHLIEKLEIPGSVFLLKVGYPRRAFSVIMVSNQGILKIAQRWIGTREKPLKRGYNFQVLGKPKHLKLIPQKWNTDKQHYTRPIPRCLDTVLSNVTRQQITRYNPHHPQQLPCCPVLLLWCPFAKLGHKFTFSS